VKKGLFSLFLEKRGRFFSRSRRTRGGKKGSSRRGGENQSLSSLGGKKVNPVLGEKMAEHGKKSGK